MKKVVIVVIGILMIIPVVTKRIINNRNYELDTATEVYTKTEVDSKLAEIRKSIESNTTAITETKNLLTTIQNSLKNYALKTALIEANSNIDNLLTIANNNTKRIDALENMSCSTQTLNKVIIYKAPSIRGGVTVSAQNYEIDLTNAAYIFVGIYGNSNNSLYSPMAAFYFSDDPDNWAGIGGYKDSVTYGKGYMPVFNMSGTKELVVKNLTGSREFLDEITVYYFN